MYYYNNFGDFGGGLGVPKEEGILRAFTRRSKGEKVAKSMESVTFGGLH
jgi:hypothetical protein